MDVFSPFIIRRRTAGQLCDKPCVERRGEASEDPCAEGRDDFGRSTLMSEDDALYSRPDAAHLLQQGEIFLDGAIGAGDNNSEGSHPQTLQGVSVPNRIFYGNLGSRDCIADFVA